METISQSNARKRALRSRKCEKRDNGSTLWGFQRISMRAKGRILRYIINPYIKYVLLCSIIMKGRHHLFRINFCSNHIFSFMFAISSLQFIKSKLIS